MGLKRKASFTASPDATPVLPGAIPTPDETSRYLPSRTRKRFRDNRPDEQTIYAQTLRWLFSAAQKPTPALPADEPTSPPAPEPESIDSRQQTLDKFFRRVKSSVSPADKSAVPQQMETPSSGHWTMIKSGNEGNTLMSSDESGSNSPTSMTVDVEMDM
ncbi:conserved hypothetical protein [Paecilomyces variotii No. 5]|uniref:Uncharacterized protein n=1 Tax=Byssochlamys spectabilis (strain No. 5 / NBRC 109023) TaxID=1356009 RepID=V5HSS8_BYSSN|nr:conserved hypothetical protein [Paecilomyces variotii No. 5]